jgi:hypothetical protein
LQTFKIVATDPFTGLKNDEVTEDITLYCQVTSMSFQEKVLPAEIGYMPGVSGIKEYKLPYYTTHPDRCIEPYTLALDWYNQYEFPNWIYLSHDSTKIVIAAGDKSLNGEVEFIVVAKVAKYNVVDTSLKFMVKFGCVFTDVVMATYMNHFTYYITQPTTVIQKPLPDYSLLPTYCPPEQASISVLLSTNSTIVQPSDFVTLDAANRLLTFSASNLNLLGTYLLSIITVEARNGANARVSVAVKIDCKISSISSVITGDIRDQF